MFPTYNFRALIIEESVVLVFEVTESKRKKSKFQLQATESMRKKIKASITGQGWRKDFSNDFVEAKEKSTEQSPTNTHTFPLTHL